MSRRKKNRKTRENEARAAVKHLRAVLRYLRASPRKVKPLADMIRGLKVDAALAVLDHTPRAAARPMAAMLRSAVSNAASRQDVDIDRLVVKEVQVSPGPMLKRWMPRALGRATRIYRRTSHISFRLEAGKK